MPAKDDNAQKLHGVHPASRRMFTPKYHLEDTVYLQLSCIIMQRGRSDGQVLFAVYVSCYQITSILDRRDGMAEGKTELKRALACGPFRLRRMALRMCGRVRYVEPLDPPPGKCADFYCLAAHSVPFRAASRDLVIFGPAITNFTLATLFEVCGSRIIDQWKPY